MKKITLFIICITISFVSLVVKSQDWPRWSGPNSDLTGTSTGANLTTSPSQAKLIWKSQDSLYPGQAQETATALTYCQHWYERPSGGTASPVVKDGKVIIYYWVNKGPVFPQSLENNCSNFQPFWWYVNADDIVACYDLNTGKRLWRTVFADSGYNVHNHKGKTSGLTPVIIGNKVVAQGATLKLYCLDLNTGAVNWVSRATPGCATKEAAKLTDIANKTNSQISTGRDYAQNLTFADGVAIVTNQGNTIAGIDTTDGHKLWEKASIIGSKATPVVWKDSVSGKEYVVAQSSTGALSCIDPLNGNTMWQITGLGALDYNMPYGKGFVFPKASNGSVACYKLGVTGPTLKWSFDPAWGYFNNIIGAVVHNGYALLRLYNGTIQQIHCVRISDGILLKSVNISAGWRNDESLYWMAENYMIQHANTQHANPLEVMFYDISDPANFVSVSSSQTIGVYGDGSWGYATPLSYPYINGKLLVRGKFQLYCYDLTVPAGNISVSITSPVTNFNVNANTSCVVTATATTTSGSINKVEFYYDSIKIGESSSAPYQITIPSVGLGTHSFYAKAINSLAESKNSYPILIRGIEISKLKVMATKSTWFRVYPLQGNTKEPMNLNYGSVQLFKAEAYNNNDEIITGLTYSYTITGGGTLSGASLTADAVGGPYYFIASATYNGKTKKDTITFNVIKNNQTISFDSIPNLYVDNSGYKMHATASSGLPVTFSIVSGPAILKGDTLVPTGTSGTIQVKASQPGNVGYNAATDVTRTLLIKDLPVLTKVVISPDKTDVPFDGVWVFTAVSYDQNNEIMPVQPSLSWNAVSGGTINSDGIFSAGSVVGGPHNIIVTATQGAVTKKDTSLVTIIPHYRTISVNFGPTYLGVTDYAGAIFKSNWNNASVTSTNLVDDKGVTTTAALTTTGMGASYTTLDAITDGNSKLFKSLRGNLGAGTGYVYVTGLPSQFYTQGYDVYVYWQGHDATTRTISYTVKGQTYYLKDNTGTWDGILDQSTATTSGTAVVGKEYIKFTGLTTDSFSIKISSSSQRWGISGFQVVTSDNTPIVKQNQTITFTNPGDQYYQGMATQITLSATSSSGLPVYYTVLSGPASVLGNKLTLTGLGPVSIKARQPGNEAYNAATAVTQNFNVLAKLNQSISWAAIPDPLMVSSIPYNYTITATANSGLTVQYIVVVGNASMVNANTLKIDQEGIITLQATQAGNTQYNAATAITQEFEVVLGTGNKEISSNLSKAIFPNPVRINLFIKGYINSDIKLLDITGKVLQIRKQINEKEILNLSNLPSGIYILQITNGKDIYYQKIIKK